VSKEPGVERYEELLALVHNNRAVCLGPLKRDKERIEAHEKSLALYEAIATRSSRNLDARHNAGRLRLNAGTMWSDKKDYARAINEFRKAEIWMLPVAEELKGVPEYRSMLGSLYVTWSRALLALKDVRKAEELANRAVQIWTDLKYEGPLGGALGDRANCLRE